MGFPVGLPGDRERLLAVRHEDLKNEIDYADPFVGQGDGFVG